MKKADIAIIGGSGLYKLLDKAKEMKIKTPYGSPSDKIAIGKISGMSVAFLPRHGKKHQFPPHMINYPANLWALKSLGVEEIITVTAAGSLQKNIHSGDFVILDQFVDRTRGRIDTFYDGPQTTHVSMADPYCPRLSKLAYKTAMQLKLPVHRTGTVVVIQGPRFSTKAESAFFTKMGWDTVNMTQYPEAALAHELSICYCAIALITDYDAGLVAGGNVKPVKAEDFLKVFSANIEKAKKLVLEMLKSWPKERSCQCKNALVGAQVG